MLTVRLTNYINCAHIDLYMNAIEIMNSENSRITLVYVRRNLSSIENQSSLLNI